MNLTGPTVVLSLGSGFVRFVLTKASLVFCMCFKFVLIFMSLVVISEMAYYVSNGRPHSGYSLVQSYSYSTFADVIVSDGHVPVLLVFRHQ